MRHPASRGRVDANQSEIVAALEGLYCTVVDTHIVGGGFPDLVIGCNGRTLLCEVKTSDGVSTAHQRTFARDWRGSPIRIVRTIEEAIAWIAAERR